MNLNEIYPLKWGLSKTEYMSKISNATKILESNTQNCVVYSDEFENKTAGIVAYFIPDGSENKLARIVISIIDFSTDTQRKFIFAKIISDLKRKYGEANSRDTTTIHEIKEFRVSEIDVWKTEDTIIIAILSLSEHDCQKPGLSIAFGDIDTDPVSKQWNWIDKTQHNISLSE